MGETKWKVVIVETMDLKGDTHRMLEEAGCDILLGRPISEANKPYTEEELIQMCRDADGIMGSSRERYTRRLMENCPRLKVISKYGTGTEKIDIEAATQLGILVTNTPVKENYLGVAETAIGMMLASLKKIVIGQEHVRKGRWRDDTLKHTFLFGRTVGIVGFGRIGSEVARRLSTWGVKLIAYDPWVQQDQMTQKGVEKVGLDELLNQADVITLHVTIGPRSKIIFDRTAFLKMKNTAILINTARAEAIDEEALIEALKEGRIAGAALDMTAKEPPSLDNPLLSMDNVIVTPHVASWTRESEEAIVKAGAENLIRSLRGQDPIYIKNPEVMKTWRQRFVTNVR